MGTSHQLGSQASQHFTGGHRLVTAAARAPARHAEYGAPLSVYTKANWAAIQRRCAGTLPEAASITETIGVELSRFLPLSQSQRWTATQYRKIVAEMQVMRDGTWPERTNVGQQPWKLIAGCCLNAARWITPAAALPCLELDACSIHTALPS